MAVTCTGEDRVLTLHISGEVDHHGAGKLMTEMDAQMETRFPKTLTLDLSGVTFMDSSGIAVLLRAYKRMSAVGGSLTVTGVPPQAERVLKAAGLYRLLHFLE
ncbi:MAG: STAS domain-containing protein [Oscillospiraceae bacterium]|nr:STAS domain-containing protein [Oscillospiraceae bacterium]